MAGRGDKAAEFRFPLKGWDTNWARQDQPANTTPDALNVWPYDLDRRARGAKRPGFSVLTGGTIGTVPVTYRQARLCAGDALAGYFVPVSEMTTYPWVFQHGGDDGVCLHVEGTDPAVASPAGTILTGTGAHRSADCDACDDITPPPPPPAEYRRLRRCTDNTFAAFYIDMADVPSFPNAYKRTADGLCYRVQIGDPVTTTPGTLIGAHATFSLCAACLDDGGGDPPTEQYLEALFCSGEHAGEPSGHFILLDQKGLDDLPFYFRPAYDPSTVLYVPEGATPVTELPEFARVLDLESMPPDLYVADSCTPGCGSCYRSMPAHATVTLSGVALASCLATADARMWAGGFVDGDYELDYQGLGDGGVCQYRTAVASTTAAIYFCFPPNPAGCDACGDGGDPFVTQFYVFLQVVPLGGGLWKYRVAVGLDPTYPSFFEGLSAELPECLAAGVAVPNGYTSWRFVGTGAADYHVGKQGTAYVTLED